MNLENKNILIISPEPWTHIFVSKHHYAIHLAHRGNQVFFLNPPSGKNELLDSGIDGLTVLDYKGFLSGMRFLPKIIRKALTRQKWEQIQKLASVQFDVIWSFDNSVFYDFDALPKSVLKISHIVDLNQDFMTAVAAKTADICFGVTSELVKRATLYNANSFFINHGYNNSSAETDLSISLPGVNQIKAMYVGNLAMQYLDWDLLYNAAINHPEIDFVFIGPNGDNCSLDANRTHSSKKLLKELSNAYFLPKIESHEIPSYLKLGDLHLISYQEKYLLDQSNSHKLLEYLGSGIPIVATFTAEYSDKKHLLYMSHSNSDWLSVFEYVSSNMSECSSQLLVSMRKEFAMQNTYNKQIDRIQELITNEVRK